MPVVVGLVVGPVRLVQLRQPGQDLLDGRGAGQVDDQRPDLGAQEVVGAGGAELRDAADFANAAGSVCATKKGAIPALADRELIETCRASIPLLKL